VKAFRWHDAKNERLKRQRGVSFEAVVLSIAGGGLLDILEHPNPAKYPDQKIFVVRIDEYAYLVPFVETADEVFLKTIIPSRKATRAYLPGEAADA
jgi:hypothetical protein